MKYSSLLIIPFTLTLFACETGQLNSAYQKPPNNQEIDVASQPIDQMKEEFIPSETIEPKQPIQSNVENETLESQIDTFISLDQEELPQPEANTNTDDPLLSLEKNPDDITVHFGFDSADLSEGDIEQLIQTADFLIANPEYRVEIAGFTDNFGAQTYNQELSQKRADQVKSILKSRGVPDFQITATGLGSTNPISSVAKLNRRVEMKFEKTLFGLIKDSQTNTQSIDGVIQ